MHYFVLYTCIVYYVAVKSVFVVSQEYQLVSLCPTIDFSKGFYVVSLSHYIYQQSHCFSIVILLIISINCVDV